MHLVVSTGRCNTSLLQRCELFVENPGGGSPAEGNAGATPDSALAGADGAMYLAKQAGSNQSATD